MKKFLAILLSVLMLISLLAACSNGTEDDDNNDDDKDNVNNDDKNNDDKNNDDKDNEEPKWTYKDATETVVWHSGASYASLDKWANPGGDALTGCSYLLFNGLLDQDETGKTIACLAEEWKMAEDNMSCWFKLREDVYFTNGDHMTAEDVAFSFMSIVEDTENRPDSYANNWRLYIEDMEVKGDYEVTMKFKQIMPEFWSQIILPTSCVIPKDYYEEVGYDKFWEAPVGTGAYKVVEYDAPNYRLKVTIRDDEHGYWKWAEDESSHTNVKTIEYAASAEGTTRMASLRTGEVDFIDSVPTADIPNIEAEGYTKYDVVPSTVTYLQVASGEGDIMEDKDLREALSLSIDRQLLVDSILDGNGEPVDFPAREGQYGYTAKNDDTVYKYDPDRAKEILDASDYNGEAIDFLYSSGNPTTNEMCVAISSMASDVGLNLELNGVEGSVYATMRVGHEFDVTYNNIGSGTSHWYKLANNVIGVDRFSSYHQNEEQKQLGLDIGKTLDPEKLEELYSELWRITTTTYDPDILLYWPRRYDASQNDITHILWHGYTSPDLSQLWVEK